MVVLPDLLRLLVSTSTTFVSAWSAEPHAARRPVDAARTWAAAFRTGAGGSTVASVAAGAKAVVRFLSVHTGLPALLVAALLVVVGYRVLKRTARIAVEIAAITAALLVATELGWIRW